MFGNRWRLFRISGIPLYLDVSWLVIAALLTVTLREQFKLEDSTLSAGAAWAMGVVACVAFFACIVLHEFGHAVVGRARGVPFRSITLFLFGGVAEMGGEPPSASAEFLMAIAGPVVSAILAGIFWGVSLAGSRGDWPLEVQLVLRYLAAINVLVLGFNLIPAFPLDGGRVLRSALWGWTDNLRRATRWAAALGRGFGVLLIALGVAEFFLGAWVGGIWLGLIGMFLNKAAKQSYQQVVVRQALRGEPVARFMTTEPIVVPPSTDLRSWVEDYVYRFHRKAFPVAENGHLAGLITTNALATVPREEWDRHTVGELAEPHLDELSINPHADALDALEQIQRTGSSRLLVVEDGRLVGIISLKDLLGFLNLKLELEPTETP
jgi:Zn-dependent protease/CBS domain-containing protein